MAKIPTQEPDVKDKLFTLYTELRAAEQDKKDTAKAHSDNVKRIKAEINDLLDEEEDGVKQSQKSIDE